MFYCHSIIRTIFSSTRCRKKHGPGALYVRAPSPAVARDGLWRERRMLYTLVGRRRMPYGMMGNRRMPNGMDSEVPKTTKLYFRLLFRVYSFKVKSKVTENTTEGSERDMARRLALHGNDQSPFSYPSATSVWA